MEKFFDVYYQDGDVKTFCYRSGLAVSGDGIYSLAYFADDEWGREGRFKWRVLEREQTVISGRFNRERYRRPAVFASELVLYTQI